MVTPRLHQISVGLFRFLASAWIGAAALFVLTSVAEQTHSRFDSMIRDQLAVIRFPYYYAFGFAVHALSSLLAVVAWRSSVVSRRRRFLTIVVLVVVSGILITLDYLYIYSPLRDLITPPGNVRDARFIQLHQWSRRANECHLTAMLLAALISCWPHSVKCPAES